MLDKRKFKTQKTSKKTSLQKNLENPGVAEIAL